MRLNLAEITLDRIEVYAEFHNVNVACEQCGECGGIVVIVVADIAQTYDVCRSCAERRGILW